jgi:hypothetical protein
VKEISHRSLHIALFHEYEISGAGKSIEIESTLAVAKGWEATVNRSGFLLG